MGNFIGSSDHCQIASRLVLCQNPYLLSLLVITEKTLFFDTINLNFLYTKHMLSKAEPGFDFLWICLARIKTRVAMNFIPMMPSTRSSPHTALTGLWLLLPMVQIWIIPWRLESRELEGCHVLDTKCKKYLSCYWQDTFFQSTETSG